MFIIIIINPCLNVAITPISDVPLHFLVWFG